MWYAGIFLSYDTDKDTSSKVPHIFTNLYDTLDGSNRLNYVKGVEPSGRFELFNQKGTICLESEKVSIEITAKTSVTITTNTRTDFLSFPNEPWPHDKFSKMNSLFFSLSELLSKYSLKNEISGFKECKKLIFVANHPGGHYKITLECEWSSKPVQTKKMDASEIVKDYPRKESFKEVEKAINDHLADLLKLYEAVLISADLPL